MLAVGGGLGLGLGRVAWGRVSRSIREVARRLCDRIVRTL